MVFDAFTFFNELDLLELRLSILDPYVDQFILVESHQTFSGQSKPLYYQENIQRFAKWNHKILQVIPENIEVKETLFERHWLCYELIEGLLKELGQDEDIAFCSDLDEIWNPEILKQIDDKSHSLVQYNYCYYLNNRSSEEWLCSLMTKIKNIHPGFNKKERTDKPHILENGGWHFTNQGGIEQILKKTTAYDHAAELNHEWLKEHTQENMDKGLDYLGRELDYYHKPFRFWLEEDKWPEYLKQNRQKYIHLLK